MGTEVSGSVFPSNVQLHAYLPLPKMLSARPTGWGDALAAQGAAGNLPQGAGGATPCLPRPGKAVSETWDVVCDQSGK